MNELEIKISGGVGLEWATLFSWEDKKTLFFITITSLIVSLEPKADADGNFC